MPDNTPYDLLPAVLAEVLEGIDEAAPSTAASFTRETIDKRAPLVAEERGCSCGGARNCGCWNLAWRLLADESRLAGSPTSMSPPAEGC